MLEFSSWVDALIIVDAALGFLNHLLNSEDWARDRLKAFAGQTAQLELGTLALPLEISPEGLFIAGTKRSSASVTITLPFDAPLRAIDGRASLFTTAQISGSAELAETLGFVFRNLRWDVESDLSQFVGDIASRRLVEGSKKVARWHRQQAKNLALNVAEFLSEESLGVSSRQDVSAFGVEVTNLQEAVTRLEKRLASLES